MKAAYDAGVNFFDTAEGYAGGDSEIAMGKAIKKFGWKRNDLVISTKVCIQPLCRSATNFISICVLFNYDLIFCSSSLDILGYCQWRKCSQQQGPVSQTHHRRIGLVSEATGS